MALETPEDWLPVLTRRLDDRRPRIDLLRSYTNGNAPLPEMGRNVRVAWERFQRKARTNFGDLIVEALAERLIPNGVRVGQASTDDDTARTIWRSNRMDVAVADTIRDMLAVSVGYMVVGRDADGRAVVTSEQPEFMYAATDPLRPWVARAAVKVWRDLDEGFDYAFVWASGQRQKFRRPMHDTTRNGRKQLLTRASGTWEPVGDPELYSGAPPVVVFENHSGVGEFEPHTDLIDRINLVILQRMVTIAMQAFRQRAIKGNLPETVTAPDGSEKKIDWAAVFSPAPGALWELPEGIEIWESQESAQSIQSMLNAVKDDIRDLSAVTRTPLPMVAPEGQNQSAAGAEFSKEGLVMKAKDRIARITPSLAEVMKIALQVENSAFEETVTVGFMDPTWVSYSEKYAAAVEAKSVDIPFRWRAINILGFTADEVDQMEIDMAAQELTLAATSGEPV